MLASHAYLFGTLGLGILFVLLCSVRRDLRRLMVVSGSLYLVYGFVLFLFIKLLASEPTKSITPGYWSPPSLLELNQKTGGYGVEDAIFSFFAGGIAAGLYEIIFKFNVSGKSDKKLNRGHALLFALLIGSIFLVIVPVNA